MKIMITGCGDPNAWYANKIGEIFEVIGEFKDEQVWLCKSSKTTSGKVKFSDGIVHK